MLCCGMQHCLFATLCTLTVVEFALQAIASTCEKKTQMQDLQAHLRSGMGDTKSVDPSALPDANSAASLQITFESIERHVRSL